MNYLRESVTVEYSKRKIHNKNKLETWPVIMHM